MTDKELEKIVKKVLNVTNNLTFYQNVTIYGSCMLSMINNFCHQSPATADECFERLQSAFKQMFDAQFKRISHENVRIPANETTIES